MKETGFIKRLKVAWDILTKGYDEELEKQKECLSKQISDIIDKDRKLQEIITSHKEIKLFLTNPQFPCVQNLRLHSVDLHYDRIYVPHDYKLRTVSETIFLPRAYHTAEAYDMERKNAAIKLADFLIDNGLLETRIERTGTNMSVRGIEFSVNFYQQKN